MAGDRWMVGEPGATEEEKRAVHKSCFACQECGTPLSLVTYSWRHDKLYCSLHTAPPSSDSESDSSSDEADASSDATLLSASPSSSSSEDDPIKKKKKRKKRKKQRQKERLCAETRNANGVPVPCECEGDDLLALETSAAALEEHLLETTQSSGSSTAASRRARLLRNSKLRSSKLSRSQEVAADDTPVREDKVKSEAGVVVATLSDTSLVVPPHAPIELASVTRVQLLAEKALVRVFMGTSEHVSFRVRDAADMDLWGLLIHRRVPSATAVDREPPLVGSYGKRRSISSTPPVVAPTTSNKRGSARSRRGSGGSPSPRRRSLTASSSAIATASALAVPPAAPSSSSASSSPLIKNRRRGGKSKGNVNVFSDSLEAIMLYQQTVYPNLAIPCLLNFLTEEIIRLGGFRAEGIFRISVGQTLIQQLVSQISKAKVYGNYKLPKGTKDPNLPAAMLKQWLRDLPVPVFTEYDRCIKAAAETPLSRETFLGILRDMSPMHREVALYVIEFLIDVGHPDNAKVTKMHVENLALVFVPSFLRSSADDPMAMLANQPLEQKFVTTLINFCSDREFMKKVRAPAKQ